LWSCSADWCKRGRYPSRSPHAVCAALRGSGSGKTYVKVHVSTARRAVLGGAGGWAQIGLADELNSWQDTFASPRRFAAASQSAARKTIFRMPITRPFSGAFIRCRCRCWLVESRGSAASGSGSAAGAAYLPAGAPPAKIGRAGYKRPRHGLLCAPVNPCFKHLLRRRGPPIDLCFSTRRQLDPRVWYMYRGIK